MASALLVLSIIDFRTYEIPFSINIFIGILGIIRVIQDYNHWLTYLIGFCSVSLFLLFLYGISGGRAIGGGDIKLMAAAGLVLGWKSVILAFFCGCILASVIHLIRMKISNEEHILAFGPYLSMGIFLTMLYGESFLTWYISICLG
jgi:leader peptidase (prepilin peptidase)/N-methyltransferase